MPTLVMDQHVEQRIRAERAASGADRFDETWKGLYVMNPMPNDEHQQLVNRLASIFQDIIDWPGKGHVRPGVNVSDRRDNWQANYRVPDVAVFLNGGSATNCGEFWFGGPDFAVEIVSPADRTHDKLAFYAGVGVRELLVVNRRPWNLELFRLRDRGLVLVGNSLPENEAVLTSQVLPFAFRLQPDTPRPRVVVTQVPTERVWRV